MLTPEQLANIPNSVIELYSHLETFIIEDFARRVAKTGKITSTAEWIVERSKDIGISNQLIEKEVARILGLSIAQLQLTLDESASASVAAENKLYEKAGLTPLKIKGNPILENYLEAAIKQTKGELQNITKSLGFAVMENGKVKYKPIAKFYQDTLNLAQMKVSTGVQDYNSAIKEAVKKMTDSGLRYVDYTNGWSNHVDVAVRRSVLTATNQMSQKINDKTIKDLELDIVEVTAHSGARDKGTESENHKSWQGKWYSLSGKSKEYPSLNKVTGYGTGEGLGGYNCRHQYYGVIPGISTPTYTEKQLKNIDPKPFGYKGKKYTSYEANQYQRKIETAIRNTKRQLIGYKAAGLKDEFKQASILLQQQKKEYKEFSSAAGLRIKSERTQVIGFDKFISQKAVSTSKKKFESGISKVYKDASSQKNVKVSNEIAVSEDVNSSKTKMNLKLFGINEKEELQKLIANGVIDRNNYNECYSYFKRCFEEGINTPLGTVYDKGDRYVHIARRHQYMVSKEQIDNIVDSLKEPDAVYKTKDKFGSEGNGYLKKINENELLTIVKDGIITSYYPTKNYINKVKRGEIIWEKT